jgi:hypothetical protein
MSPLRYHPPSPHPLQPWSCRLSPSHKGDLGEKVRFATLFPPRLEDEAQYERAACDPGGGRQEITTATISWASKAHPGDKVKLEVWDVVDQAPAKRKAPDAAGSLSLEHAKPREAGSVPRAKAVAAAKALTEAAKTSTYMSKKQQAQLKEAAHAMVPLDATTVDVYRGADAVIFMIDPSKPWTFDYVKRHMPHVPARMPVAIVCNFRDMPASLRCGPHALHPTTT